MSKALDYLTGQLSTAKAALNPGLTPDQRQLVETRIASLERQIEAAEPAAPAKDE